LCVQRRLACSAGDRPAGARVRSPVAWIAERREIEFLKPIDNRLFGRRASHRAVMKMNVDVASKIRIPEGRACNRRAKAAWIAEKSDRCGYLTSAGWKRRHDDKDMLSNWRSPPRPSAKSLEQGRPYNRRHREVGRRREGGGWVRISDEAGQCRRSEGTLLFVMVPTKWEARVNEKHTY
jgi:hypothetical protein